MRVPPWVLVPSAGEPLGAAVDDVGHVTEGLDVVDDGRLVEGPLDGRKGRLELGPALLALQRGDQSRLLPADVGPGAPVHHDVELRPQQAGRVGFPHGPAEAPPGLDVLAADVDEAEPRPDGAGRDEHALDEGVRIALEEVAILERSRLALVGIDHEVHGSGVVLGDERPLGARGKAGAAETAEVRLLDLLHDGRGVHLPGPLEGGVAAALAVGRTGCAIRGARSCA